MAGPEIGRLFKQRKMSDAPRTPTCKFIICDRPYGPDPWCGKPSVIGFSYCQHHKEICYRPMDPVASRSFNSHAVYVARTTR